MLRFYRHPRLLMPLWLLVFFVATTKLTTTAADDSDTKKQNEKFDPDADNTLDCSIPPYQDTENYFRPVEGQCLATASSLTGTGLQLEGLHRAALHRLAVAYAPVIYFHPLEKYTLSSVENTFSNPDAGRIWSMNQENEIFDPQLNLTTLLRTSRDPVLGLKSKQYFFERDIWLEMYDSPPSARYGDGYDSDGRSKAKIYYNAFESGNGTWTFNYYLYYEYNGEGNMGIVSSNEGPEGQNVIGYTQFQLRPYGTHEGDWESLSVMVCPPVSNADIFDDNIPEPLAVHYRQHSWGTISDCTQGECKFYRDTYHPVGFCALNSHATYQESAEELIYSKIQVGFFFNLQAFLVVDRTMYKKEDGSYNYFFPDVSNLERLQNPADLTLEATELTKHFWQGFGGHFGNSAKLKVDPEPPRCLADDQLSFVECPTREEDKLFDLVMQLMGVREARTDVLKYVQAVSNEVVKAFSETGNGPNGPVTKHYYEKWVKPKNSPFWNNEANTTTSEEYCNGLLSIPNITYAAIEPKDVKVADDVMALIAVVSVLTVLNFLVPLLALIIQGRSPYSPIRYFRDGVLEPPKRNCFGTLQYSIGALIYTIFFAIMFVAAMLFLKYSRNMLTTLETFVPDIDFSFARDIVEILGVVILVVNSLLLIFLWMQVFEMRGMIHHTYLRMSGVNKTELPQRFVPWNTNVVDVLFRCGFAILFMSLMLSMICVVIGKYTMESCTRLDWLIVCPPRCACSSSLLALVLLHAYRHCGSRICGCFCPSLQCCLGFLGWLVH